MAGRPERIFASFLLFMFIFHKPIVTWFSSLLNTQGGARAKASASSPASAASQDKNALFLDWFKSNGGHVNPSVELTTFPLYGRGLSAASDVGHMDTLFTAPASIVLTAASVAGLYPM